MGGGVEVLRPYKKSDKMIFSLAWNIMFTDNWKVLVLGNTVFFWVKKWKRWYLLITEKFLFLTFWSGEMRPLFESRSWWKDHIYWLPRSSCFELFGNGKYDLFLSQKVGGKIIFIWSFWAFHYIPGLGKYGFSCSASNIFQNVFCQNASRRIANFGG